MAFAFFNPRRGKDVYVDGCQYSSGDPQEYKGHYADHVAKPFFTNGPLKDKFLDQAKRQIQALEAANIKNGRINTDQWRFDERQTADFAWKIFERAGFLGRGKIRIHYTPYEEHIDELYPDPEN